MKLTKHNAAAFVTVANSMQHYARAARDYFANPTAENKAQALRKGQLFYGHLLKMTGEPQYVWCLAHSSGEPFGNPCASRSEAEAGLAELMRQSPNLFNDTGIAKLRVLP
jgi:hypothetical protein